MCQAHSDIMSALNGLNNSVSALQGEWVGNAATQFQGEYQQWRAALNNALETLEMLTHRLENEINEWEAADSRF